MPSFRWRATRTSRAVLPLAVAAGVLVGLPAGQQPAVAAPNGLALTPPMGFNDWNAFGCNVDETLIKQTADLFVSTGLKAAGYQYVNIDDCWLTHDRDPATGRLVPDPVKFPDGISGTAAYVHSLGLKLGIYEDAGTATCAGFPGSLGHERLDAQTFADWGVDYLKYDNCNNNTDGTRQDFVNRYTAMRDALAATGRPIVYSMSEWGQSQPWEWAQSVGNLWRTTGDIGDNFASMVNILEQNAPLAPHAGPGTWNDPDMLEIGNGGMTDAEYRSHFSLWAVMAAPLLIGTDLRKASPQTLAILGNRDVIAVDQDRLGKQGTEVADAGGHHVFVKPLAGGDVAVALFNETDRAAVLSTTAAAAGLPAGRASYTLTDLWSKRVTASAGTIAAGVPGHSTVLFRVSGTASPRTEPATAIAADIAPPYAGAPVISVAGTATPVTVDFRNLGPVPISQIRTTLTVPPGWQARPVNSNDRPIMRPNNGYLPRWQVTAPPGTAAGTYQLAARSAYFWTDQSGRRQSSVDTQATTIAVTPLAAGASLLGDDPWVSSVNGWGPAERNMSNGEMPAGDGRTLTIDGMTFASGIGAHAPSTITVYTGGRCTTVAAFVGVDDEKLDSPGNAVGFQVWGDQRMVAESSILRDTGPGEQLTANVAGATFVRLVVTDGGDGTGWDHADWGDARITCG
ncbi:MAG: alpha-galactosidase [Mycobacteriales bacterium]|jgi:alpha-galactosidase